MKIYILSDGVLIRGVNFGESFAGMQGDVKIKNQGQVKVKTGNIEFYTVLTALGRDILSAVEEHLRERVNNKVAKNIRLKILRAMRRT